MTNEQAAMIAAASYIGAIDGPGKNWTRTSPKSQTKRICTLAVALLDVLDRGTLVGSGQNG